MNRVCFILVATFLVSGAPLMARLNERAPAADPSPAPSSEPSPAPSSEPTPAPSPEPSPSPTPAPCFSSVCAAFISYSDDVAALKAWYETLTTTEQEQYSAQLKVATDKLAAAEEALVALVTNQIDNNHVDKNLYTVFEIIRGMDAIKARKVFGGALAKLALKVNGDYLATPSNPDTGRRARDLQAVRAYIGHPGAAPARAVR